MRRRRKKKRRLKNNLTRSKLKKVLTIPMMNQEKKSQRKSKKKSKRKNDNKKIKQKNKISKKIKVFILASNHQFHKKKIKCQINFKELKK